jgi:hypothetical protein
MKDKLLAAAFSVWAIAVLALYLWQFRDYAGPLLKLLGIG